MKPIPPADKFTCLITSLQNLRPHNLLSSNHTQKLRGCDVLEQKTDLLLFSLSALLVARVDTTALSSHASV